MESKKQQQTARIIQMALGEIFQKEGFNWWKNALVTISGVRLTPDLLTARVYISIFNASNNAEILNTIQQHLSHIRHLLGQKIRHKVRRMPELEFFEDNSLDEVFKMEQLFDNLKKDNQL
ncbi:MAG: 30S ribosome-binding factor RbfA [Chitinophagales bacterium]|nr:30S ribosome-binding factor RbfA [Bacteroidota bacterium]MCB9043986.1 30S ribosome-binding factor RbfA [Chitinophagales bacterium]